MAVLNIELRKLMPFMHHEPQSPRELTTHRMQELCQTTEPQSDAEKLTFLSVLLAQGYIVDAYQFALDIKVDYDNFHAVDARVVDLAGGYSPGDTLPERRARALIRVGNMPLLERQALATPKRHLR